MGEAERKRGGEAESPGADEPAAPAQNAAAAVPSPEELAELRNSAAKTAEFLDLLQHTQAEFVNYRKRVQRDKDEARFVQLRELVQLLLPVLDTLDLALASAPADGSPLRAGVTATRAAFEQALMRMGVEPYVSVGQPFDSGRHEPIGTVARADLAPGTVAEELLRGFAMAGRTIRPARVRLAAAPPSSPAKRTAGDPEPARGATPTHPTRPEA